jgi:hypothetical protein
MWRWHGKGTKPRQRCSFSMGSNKEATRRAIQHYRRLREWVTDPQARKALRELMRKEEAELEQDEDKDEQTPDERDLR